MVSAIERALYPVELVKSGGSSAMILIKWSTNPTAVELGEPRRPSPRSPGSWQPRSNVRSDAGWAITLTYVAALSCRALARPDRT
jgi:hypothetical protein